MEFVLLTGRDNTSFLPGNPEMLEAQKFWVEGSRQRDPDSQPGHTDLKGGVTWEKTVSDALSQGVCDQAGDVALKLQA